LTECCQEWCAMRSWSLPRGAHKMAKVIPEHALVWFEIPVTDMKRAKAFYDAVFLTELQEEEGGPNPMAMFPVTNTGEGRSGHLYPGKPAAEGTGNTIHLAAPAPLEE